jgi:holliday junction DNA helicase RuvA
MIAKLKGRIDAVGADWLIIDVGGVGYHVACSSKSLAALPGQGEFAEVHTEMLVSQDMIRLVGFATVNEREWFRLLQQVQGVGTRVALALLSTLSVAEIGNAIALQDKAMIGRANGVGKKLAERIVLELKDKVPAWIVTRASPASYSPEKSASSWSRSSSWRSGAMLEAISSSISPSIARRSRASSYSCMSRR